MKQFNLEEYLNNPHRDVITRSGESVKILCTDRKNDKYPIVALVGQNDTICSYMTDGRVSFFEERNNDLFFEPRKKEGWINVYIYGGETGSDTRYHTDNTIYKAKEDALRYKYCPGYSYLNTLKIEWEEE